MLDQNLKNQLAQYLDLLKTEVTIGLSVANDENSKKVKEFIDDVASLSEKIKVEEKKLKYTPSFDLKGDFDHGEIVFAGLPLGHEFASFALALLQVGGISPKVDDKTIQRVKSLDESMDFETVVSLSCHNCPDVVQALNIMAIINPKISHTMIEGGMFKDLAESREVLAVPAIFKDDDFFEGGKQSMDNLLDLLGSEKDTSHFENKGIFDILVIGGGPAAATAGIYAARKGLKTGILADEFGGQVNETVAIENIPGFKYTEGPDFMVQMKDQVSSLGVDIMTGSLANDIKRLNDEKVVEISLDNDITLRAKTVILATGARWKLIGISGEVEFRNKGVAYCAHCDGPLFKDKTVAVIGGGNSGVEAAIDLAAMASKVTVLEFLPELKADNILQDKLRSLENVEIITNAQTTGLYGDGKVENLEFTDRVSGEEKKIDIDGCFIQVGLVPNTEWLKESDLDLNKFGEIPINKDGSTNIEGVFAAGDATETAFKQIVIATGTGATAALGAFNYLMVN